MDTEYIRNSVILVADDVASNRVLLRHIFQSEYEVEEACNGVEALEKLRTLPKVDILVLDIIMPELDGFGVLMAMRSEERLSRIPVVVLTSCNDEETQIRVLTEGAMDILTKPFSPQIILHRIRNILLRQAADRLAEQKRAAEREVQLADRDEKSGLYNKYAFFRYAARIMQENPDRQYVLVRWDIDNFKVYNDCFGIAAGDAYLRKVGEFYGEYAPTDSSLLLFARYEAEHFVSLFDGAHFTPNRVLDVLERAFSQRKTVDFDYCPRIGLYKVDDTALDVTLICDRALLALQTVKRSYGQRYAWYDDSMRQALLEAQEIANEMEQALEEGQFQVFFQPQYNHDTGTLIGAEALVRWFHPTKGMLSPDRFIPLFERNGFISKLDKYVWETTCRKLRSWLDSSEIMDVVPVSVNVSRIDVYDTQLCDNLVWLMRKYNLPMSLLKLEITESAYIQNPDQLINVVRQLQHVGFIIEMDDFGAGYSSLNTLKDVPVDILKLDMRFLENCEKNERGGNILSSVIRMAHWLKIPVIAEGVETKSQADYLKSMGCFYMQGYYFAKPMPEEAFEALLAEEKTGTADRYDNVDIRGVAAFWDPSEQATLLFNSFVGGAAIVEIRDGDGTVMRANDRFFHELGATHKDYSNPFRSIGSHFDKKNWGVFLAAVDKASFTCEETECEIQCIPVSEDSAAHWVRVRVRLLAKNLESSLFYCAVDNITRRKTAEEQLRISQQALTLAIKQMGRGLCEYNVETGELTVEKEYAKKHGLPNVVPNIPYGAFTIVAEDMDKYISFYEKLLHGEKNGTVLVRNRNADGVSYAWEKLGFTSVFGEDGKPKRAFITVEDVTAQKEHQAENARLKLLIKQTGMCIFDYNVLTDFLHYQSSLKTSGHMVLNIKNYTKYLETDNSWVHPDDKKAVGEFLRKLRRGESKSGTFEFRADNWGTGYRWGMLTYMCMEEGDGKVYRVIGQVTDIQNQKEIQALNTKLDCLTDVHGTVYPHDRALVSRVFMLLYGTDDTVYAINKVLEVLGEYYDLSRTNIFENTEDHNRFKITFEWRAAGVESAIQKHEKFDYKNEKGESYGDYFNKEGIFICKDTHTLRPEHYKLLHAQEVRSLLQCAIQDNGVFTGFMSFEECRVEREWTEEQIGTLLLVARTMGVFLTRLRKAQEIVDSEDFRIILENNPSYIYIVDSQSFKIAYHNRAVSRYYGKGCEGETCYRVLRHRMSPCDGCPVKRAEETGRAVTKRVQWPKDKWVMAQATSLRWKDENMYMVTCMDVTDVQKNEDVVI